MAKGPRGKRKRRSGGSPKKKSGLMIGMRGGFKKLAHSVTGSDEAAAKPSSPLTNVLWAVLLLGALGFFLYRRLK